MFLGVGLRQLDGDVQGHGGQVSDDEGQRDRGVLMLEQRQLHRPCYNNQVCSQLFLCWFFILSLKSFLLTQ